MSSQESIVKWIWQHKKYPIFSYNKEKLTTLISEIEYLRGVLDGYSKLFREEDIRKIEIERLTDEAIHTSLIEGEVFKRGEKMRSGEYSENVVLSLKPQTLLKEEIDAKSK